MLAEPDGTVGTVCIYEASSEAAIREHARLAELPVDEVVKVADGFESNSLSVLAAIVARACALLDGVEARG